MSGRGIVCCKGLRQVECAECGTFICPTSGHYEGKSFQGRFCCLPCCDKLEQADDMERLNQIPRELLAKLEEEISDEESLVKIREVFRRYGISAEQ